MFRKLSNWIHSPANAIATRSTSGRRLLVISAISVITISSCSSNNTDEETNPMTQVGSGGNSQIIVDASVNNQASSGSQANVGVSGGTTGGGDTTIGTLDASSDGNIAQSNDSASAQPDVAVEQPDAAVAQTDSALQGDAGTIVAEGGTDTGLASDAAVDAGPIDYSAPGPYAVITEKNVGAAFRNSVSDDTLFCELFIANAAAADPNADPEVIDQLTSYPADMDRELYTLFRPDPLEEAVAVRWRGAGGPCGARGDGGPRRRRRA